mgnify:CR=1 FL=1
MADEREDGLEVLRRDRDRHHAVIDVGRRVERAAERGTTRGELADRRLLAFQSLDRRLALRCHPFGHAAGQAVRQVVDSAA